MILHSYKADCIVPKKSQVVGGVTERICRAFNHFYIDELPLQSIPAGPSY